MVRDMVRKTHRFQQVTREQVLEVMAEHNLLGREEFLRRYGYRPARRYKIQHNGKLYDSKAILGVAMGAQANEFSGGAATVQRTLERLGFEMEVL